MRPNEEKSKPLVILLVDDREDNRALLEVILREGLVGARLLAPANAVDLGQNVAEETALQAAVVQADLSWCPAQDLVKRVRSRSPDCPVIFYSKEGIQTLTPELAELGLTAFYSESPADLLRIPKDIARLQTRKSGAGATTGAEPKSIKSPVEIATGGKPFDKTVADDSFRSEMFYEISHDLKQPLQIFRRQVTLLDDKYKKQLDAPGQGLIENMSQVARHMEILLESILAYYRLGGDDKPLDLVTISDALDSVLAALQSRLREVSAQIDVGNLPAIKVDRGPMIQLFQNLLDNAIKFRGEEPLHIEISVLDTADNWVFTVEDNGVGFDQGQAGQIFNLFKRLHSADQYPGSGVGLALCKKVIEQHGGKIWATSGKGRGASFHFTLPKESTTVAKS